MTEQSPFSLIAPKPTPPSEFHIPERFYNSVLVHVVKNTLTSLRTSLILAIQGAPGEGKSYQAREALARIGAYVVPLSGATISGPHEGDATSVLIAAYRYASAVREGDKRLAVLLIDDFDLSVAATHDGRTYTVNSQLVTGTLMNLADDPTQVGARFARVPVVITGNNFTMLYAPLTRHGRMTFFEWTPTEAERRQIIVTMLAGVLGRDELPRVDDFIQFVRDEPLSFVSAVKDDLIDTIIIEHARRGSVHWTHLENDIHHALAHCRVEDLLRVARARKHSAQSTDFTQKRKSGWGFK